MTIALLAAMTMTPNAATLYDFTMTDINQKPVSLRKFEGKTVLVVNVASKCGLTPQYEGLEKLYRDYKDQGLVVLGFPANNFNGQEPGTDAEILAFCTGKYDVTFPMFSKISVKGEDIHPLYKWLTSQTENREIEWNFAKFVIGPKGDVIHRFGSRDNPSSDAFRAKIEELLKR